MNKRSSPLSGPIRFCATAISSATIVLLGALSGPLYASPKSNQPLDTPNSKAVYETQDQIYPGGWLHSGREILATLHSNDKWQVVRINVKTGTAQPVEIPLEAVGISDIAFPELLLESQQDGQSDLFIFNIESSMLHRLTKTPEDEWHPSFSYDRSTVIYDSNKGSKLSLYARKRSGGEVTALTTDETSEQGGKLSPDGTKLAFHRHVSGSNYDVIILDIANGDEIRLTNSTADDSYPLWIPNGKAVIYSSNRAGNFDLYLSCIENRATIQLTDSKQDEKYPRLSSDGGFLLYQAKDDQSTRLDMMALDTTTFCAPDSDLLVDTLVQGKISSVNGLAISNDYQSVYATHWAASEKNSNFGRIPL